jgi:hypothetical protein
MRSHPHRLQKYAKDVLRNVAKDAAANAAAEATGDLKTRSEATEAFRLASELRRKMKLCFRGTMVSQLGSVERFCDLPELERKTPVVPPPEAVDPSPDSMDFDDDETPVQKYEREAKEAKEE